MLRAFRTTLHPAYLVHDLLIVTPAISLAVTTLVIFLAALYLAPFTGTVTLLPRFGFGGFGTTIFCILLGYFGAFRT